jgi:putative DNA methylase
MPAYRKKLIEVALPLEAINRKAAREKSIRHGHPSTLHLWWARRPLAACRAVLFGQLVDDPSAWPERFSTEAAQAAERDRLHKLIERLVPWEASTNEAILNEARWEIARSVAWNRGDEPPAKDDPAAVFDCLQTKVPPVYDPFCGGGSIPLEAQRLGLRAYGSDLNPVAVLISKALVEIPPKFAGLPPVNPESRAKIAAGGRWQGKGAQGLAEDVRYYGRWMRDEAFNRIGHLSIRRRPCRTARRRRSSPGCGRAPSPAQTRRPMARMCRWSRPSCSRRRRARKPGSSRSSTPPLPTAGASRCGPDR